MPVKIHSTAQVSDKAAIGEGTSVWNWVQIRENATLGKNCVISKSVYIDSDVKIGDNVKIQNNVSVYHGVTIEDGVFAGPHVCFTNDLYPRAVNPDGSLKNSSDWSVTKTLVKKGTAIGANSTILCGITLGEWSMVGCGSVVTHNVPAHGLVIGNPATLRGFVCKCGLKLTKTSEDASHAIMSCTKCSEKTLIPKKDFELLKR